MIQLRSTFLKASPLRLLSTSCIQRKDGGDDKKDGKTEAVNKLNSLLAELTKQKPREKVASKIDVAKPKQLKSNKEVEKKEEEPKDLAGKLEVAAKKVADTYGGDKKKTESELLNLLLAYQKDPTGESKSTDKPVLSDLLSGMKVERRVSKPRTGGGEGGRGGGGGEGREEGGFLARELQGRAGEVRQSLRGKRPWEMRVGRSDQAPQQVDLWAESSGLGIFETDKLDEFSSGPRLTTWAKLHEKELTLSVTHAPSNIYEQMIQWTNQGKLWQFPIDNEQGLVDESKIDFTQHVMLDEHLVPWCPEKGPIRSFMELVLVGLSKNPYYSVQEKIDHIFWFRDYFAYKNAIWTSLGLAEIEGGDPNFSIDVEVDFRKWGDRVANVRKDW